MYELADIGFFEYVTDCNNKNRCCLSVFNDAESVAKTYARKMYSIIKKLSENVDGFLKQGTKTINFKDIFMKLENAEDNFINSIIDECDDYDWPRRFSTSYTKEFDKYKPHIEEYINNKFSPGSDAYELVKMAMEEYGLRGFNSVLDLVSFKNFDNDVIINLAARGIERKALKEYNNH